MNPYRALWSLDPGVIYLNHGSFGACPTAVLAHQAELRAELEAEPVDFLVRRLPARLDAARIALATELGARPEDLVFVTNATSGVNAVLRSLEFAPGDELLTTSHAYAACYRTLQYVAQRSGARIVVADLPFPVTGPEAVIAAVLGRVSSRTRLALLDHVTSPTALVLPIAMLVRELAARGVDTLVDGAHAPGMLPLGLTELGAAYYTGNCHKWQCAPKGAAFLHVRADRQAALHPTVISHGLGGGLRAEFDWTGTQDPTPWLCIPAALGFMGDLLPDGWPALMARNHAAVLDARTLVMSALGVETPPAPDTMIGSIASIPLPVGAPGSAAAPFNRDRLALWCRERGVESWFYNEPVPLVRLSAQIYNEQADYRRLADLLQEALRTP